MHSSFYDSWYPFCIISKKTQNDWIGLIHFHSFDAETGIVYGVPYTNVTGHYINEAWSGSTANNIRTGTSMTDSTGKFVVNVVLPPAVGSIFQYITVSTHYYDYCGILLYTSNNSSIQIQDFIYHFAYSA